MPITKCENPQCRPDPYQDGRYGHGYRVHNVCKDDGLRCTICGNKKEKKIVKASKKEEPKGKKVKP